jgi:hypothetical protein
MSISPVTSAVTATSQNTPAAFAQEATESAATTLKEAQAGDLVAQRKLAAQKAEQAQTQASQSPALEPGKGAIVDHAA